jgi:hypothetical protein
MNRNLLRCVLAIAFSYSTGVVAYSQTTACSSADLKGDYGFSFHGKNLGMKVEMLMVGRIEADGKGNFKGVHSESVNGSIDHGPFSGTYVINPDCTGSAEMNFGGPNVEKVDIVLVDDGSEILMIDVGGNTLESGEAKRLFRKRNR